ncbi:MAG: PD-(D/E)XK nuclease family protein [Saccharofermentanales bacterium]
MMVFGDGSCDTVEQGERHAVQADRGDSSCGDRVCQNYASLPPERKTCHPDTERKNRPSDMDCKNRPRSLPRSIIFGESRHILSKICIQQACKFNSDFPDRRAILIVPETSKMDMEYDFMTSTVNQGMMMTEVLSFSRFCYRLLGEIGLNNGEVIDDAGKSMLLYKVLKENEDRFVLFKNLCKKTGFISEILSVMGDLKRVMIDASQLEKASQDMSDPVVKQKAKELSIMIREYDNALEMTSLKDPQENYSNTAAQLGILSDMKQSGAVKWPYDRLEWLFNAKIWITGFGETRDFTPQEHAMIDALGSCCEVVITVVSDKKDDTIFRAGRQCIDWFAKNGLPMDSLQYVSADETTAEDIKIGKIDEPDAVFRHLADCWKNQIPVPLKFLPNLNLVQTFTRREEVAILAGEINRLVREENFRFRDITVLAAGIESYKTIISAVFHEASIPYYMDDKKSLTGTVLARMVRNLMDIILQNWPVKALLNYARCGLSGITGNEIDEFETYMLAAGIKWKKQLFDERRYEIDFSGDDINRMPEIRDRLCRNILKFERSVAASKISGEYCDSLRAFLDDEAIAEKIRLMSGRLLEKEEEGPAIALVKAWNELTHLLEQIDLIAKDAPIDLRSFRDILISGMEKAFSGTIPSAVDQVHFAPAGQISNRQTPVLFVIGMTENDYPGKIPPEGILKDRDREAFSEYFKINIPSVLADKYYEDIFLTYSLLSLPKQKLYLSCPEPAGLESNVIDFVRKCVPDCRTITWEEAPGPGDIQIYSKNTAFYTLLSMMSDKMGTMMSDKMRNYPDSGDQSIKFAEWDAFYRMIKETPEFGPRLSALQKMVKSSQAKISLTKENIAKRYDDPAAMSISQLEKYNACAFSHFAQHLLKLQPRASHELQSTDTGSMMHGIVELAVSQFLSEYRTAKDDEQKDELIRRYRAMDFEKFAKSKMKDIADRDKMGSFLDQGFYASKGRSSYRLAAATLKALFTQIDSRQFVPGILEWEFAAKNNNAISFELENQMKVLFNGKVDRIDFHDDHFRVIDYKSGNKTVDFDEWYHGLSLQLLAYIAAFCAANPGMLPDDAAYAHFARPIISYENGSVRVVLPKHPSNIQKKYVLRGTKMKTEELMAASRFTLEKMKSLTGQLINGRYDIVPKRLKGKDSSCKYCDYQSFCGFEVKYDKDDVREPLPIMKDGQGKKLAKKDVFTKMVSGEKKT